MKVIAYTLGDGQYFQEIEPVEVVGDLREFCVNNGWFSVAVDTRRTFDIVSGYRRTVPEHNRRYFGW